MPWRGPEYEGEVPTLGWAALEWFEENLVVPEGPLFGEPLVLTPEQAQFVLDFYQVDPLRRRRRVRRGILSRSKGWGKSPIDAALCLWEGLGDAVFDGWDANGDPVGRTWRSLGMKPKVQLLAVAEDQTSNTWDPLLDMIRHGPLVDEPGVEAYDTFVTVPRGRIEPATSAANTREGFRPVFAVLDQTESWTTSNGGVRLAAAVRRNLSKTGGASLETPNAYVPGAHSVAEASFADAGLIGKAPKVSGILLDHREAPAETDTSDRESLIAGLRWAYGCSADAPCALAEAGHHPPHEPGWVDLERKVEEIWDPSTTEQDSQVYYLNQVTHASDSFVSAPVWKARKADLDDLPPLADGDVITLGFDGSRGRKRGKPDATALIGCRVADGHLFEIAVWEAGPDRSTWEAWEPPLPEVEARIDEAFRRWRVAAFYADPARDWRSYVNAWEAKYGARIVVKVRRDHPFEWWMTGGRATLVQLAVEALEGAINNGDLTHDGSATLTAHMLHARRRLRHGKLALGKEHDSSENKIDAAVAAVLAWQARLDAIAADAVRKLSKKHSTVIRVR